MDFTTGPCLAASEQKHRRSLVVNGQLCGLPARCLIDTGATDSLVSHDFYQQIPEENRPQLKAVDVQELLVGDIGIEMLLGMDFLFENTCRCQLDILTGVLLSRRERIQCRDNSEDSACFKVVGRGTVRLPSSQSSIVPARLRKVGNTSQGVIEPWQAAFDQKRMVDGHSLVSMDACLVRVHPLL